VLHAWIAAEAARTTVSAAYESSGTLGPPATGSHETRLAAARADERGGSFERAANHDHGSTAGERAVAATAMDPVAPSVPPALPGSHGLIGALAANVSRLRRNSGMDRERLAALSGLTCEQVRAVENGTATPRLRLVWALADAFAVPFGVLLAGVPCETASFHVLRAAERKLVDSCGSGFRSRPLSTAGDPREPEVYEVTLAPGWLEEAAPHAIDTFEHVVVVQGTLTIRAGESAATLAPGDVVFFRADRPHAYQNPGPGETVLHLTMTYAGDWSNGALD
jgi:quercetin dioxygenase-like cupin family protein/DNA-binding XRE family transcriptional regulator